jgi:hypothetical protein
MINELGTPKIAPTLVNMSAYKDTIERLQNKMKTKKWNINKIVLIAFAIFTVFFLYNCRYGMFRQTEEPFIGATF